MRVARVGDLLEIGEFNGEVVIGHYVYDDGNYGPIVQFYSCPLDLRVEDGLSDQCRIMFPPVFVGVRPPTRSGRWRIVGRLEPEVTEQPMFLMYGPGRPPIWFLYHRGREKRLGTEVPEEYRSLEVLTAWSFELIEDRIRTGSNPFGYEAMIKWE